MEERGGTDPQYSPKLAEQIVEIVGEPNILSATCCATRLRLVLGETPAGAKDKVAALPGVITVVESGGQFQVVIGAHVGEVHEALLSKVSIKADAGVDAPKQSIANRVIATMSAVFAPFVYIILAAAGLLQGMLILLRPGSGRPSKAPAPIRCSRSSRGRRSRSCPCSSRSPPPSIGGEHLHRRTSLRRDHEPRLGQARRRHQGGHAGRPVRHCSSSPTTYTSTWCSRR